MNGDLVIFRKNHPWLVLEPGSDVGAVLNVVGRPENHSAAV